MRENEKITQEQNQPKTEFVKCKQEERMHNVVPASSRNTALPSTIALHFTEARTTQRESRPARTSHLPRTCPVFSPSPSPTVPSAVAATSTSSDNPMGTAPMPRESSSIAIEESCTMLPSPLGGSCFFWSAEAEEVVVFLETAAVPDELPDGFAPAHD